MQAQLAEDIANTGNMVVQGGLAHPEGARQRRQLQCIHTATVDQFGRRRANTLPGDGVPRHDAPSLQMRPYHYE